MPPHLEELFRLDHELAQLRKLLREKEEERELTLAGIRSANVTRQGRYELIQKTTIKRIPGAAKFISRFPSVADQIMTVRLKEADLVLGVNVVNSLCTMQPQVSYRVIETGVPE